jgi:hypothetical protein
MANICPVCGYSLECPAADYRICPSCGTEFGYDDAGRTYSELRAAWLRSGARWWSHSRPAPAGWDAYEQINSLLEKRQSYAVGVGAGLQRMMSGTDPAQDATPSELGIPAKPQNQAQMAAT